MHTLSKMKSVSNFQAKPNQFRVSFFQAKLTTLHIVHSPVETTVEILYVVAPHKGYIHSFTQMVFIVHGKTPNG